MTEARDIMTPNVETLKGDDTVADAAKRLASGDFGALPICNSAGRLEGMVTDRDLVVKVLAQGKDPSTTKLSDIADQGEVVTIGVDDDVSKAVRTMTSHA